MSAAVEYEAVIGLEVHVQLATNSKIFSGSRADFGVEPNGATDPVVLGLPGCLPVLNRTAVDMAVRLGLAVGSKIAAKSRFARKHYFYPDLPKGYQISQHDEPICEGGAIRFRLDGGWHEVPLTRIHMEEDAGKNIHATVTKSLVDLNRSGVPLCEVVSDPALRSAEEAGAYVRALRTLVRFLGISDGNMEEGSLRCDANVSIRPKGSSKLGTKAEIKNINSFKNIKDAIEHEIRRQTKLLKKGEPVVQETRLWDAEKQVSRSMRSKEEAHDYRYFPEPDLPPLEVTDAWREDARARLPELPHARLARYMEALKLPEQDATALASERAIATYFDAVVGVDGQPEQAKKAANWILNEVLGRLEDPRDLSLTGPVAPQALAELLKLMEAGTLSGKLAKEVFAKMWSEGLTAGEIVERDGLSQVSDTDALKAACQRVIEGHPKEAERLRQGDKKLIGFFVGRVMKETQGKANPKAVNEILRSLLS